MFGKIKDVEIYKLAKKIFVDSPIKILQSPVFTPTVFNVNLIKEFSNKQLE